MSVVASRVESALALAFLASAAWLLWPVSSRAEEPCEFAGYPGIGGCWSDAMHIWAGTCEGIDCYYELEFCCPKEE